MLNLIDHLPPESHYGEALAQDDELAREALKHKDLGKRAPVVRVSQWSLEAQLLTAILDRIGLLFSAEFAAAGAKKIPKLPPSARPVTAAERVKHESARASHLALVARLKSPDPN